MTAGDLMTIGAETVPPLTPFMQRVAAAHAASGLTVKEVADHCGVTPQAVYNLLGSAPSRRPESCRFGRKLAAVLGVSPSWLLFGDESAAPVAVPAPVDISTRGLTALQAAGLTALATLMRVGKFSDAETVDLLASLRPRMS